MKLRLGTTDDIRASHRPQSGHAGGVHIFDLAVLGDETI